MVVDQTSTTSAYYLYSLVCVDQLGKAETETHERVVPTIQQGAVRPGRGGAAAADKDNGGGGNYDKPWRANMAGKEPPPGKGANGKEQKKVRQGAIEWVNMAGSDGGQGATPKQGRQRQRAEEGASGSVKAG
eukprot:1156781-Pelagomonas_calceolata.AAC.6